MNFEVDRQSSAWANIALCADLTWASEPPDEFVLANQRLLTQHCRVSKVLQDTILDSPPKFASSDPCELTDRFLEKRKNVIQNEENGIATGSRSVKDVIPESRLAQFYGNFYYDENREKCYVSPNEKSAWRNFNGHGCEKSDLTECWMLPEVEYWFRKLTDEPGEARAQPLRRRQCRAQPEHFERWGLTPAAQSSDPDAAEAALAARVRAVRDLWSPAPAPERPHAPSPPATPRKMRARRRQPRRVAHYAPPPRYCLDAPAPLLCDPTYKFQFEVPRPSQLNDCHRSMARLSASVHARSQHCRGISFRPQGPRAPERRVCCTQRKALTFPQPEQSTTQDEPVPSTSAEDERSESIEDVQETPETANQDDKSSPRGTQTDKPVDQACSTSTGVDGMRTKRLYSTVLSMRAPQPLNLAPVVRLSQKQVIPGLLKLNPKIILPAARIRPTVDNKYEELEKEALDQYKASDESIDTKFNELEKQAVEQYTASSTNTCCGSGSSSKRRNAPAALKLDTKKSAKLNKAKTGSVVIYSQNFPDASAKGQTSSVASLKNCQTPPRGEKKQAHKPRKNLRSFKSDQRPASDTDYEPRVTLKGHKVPLRWSLHVAPPKKRMKKNLTMCVSDIFLDKTDDVSPMKNVRSCTKNHVVGKIKMSAHGAGDLQPIARKT